ncbi:MAG TPA: TatD family hydrolase, partial [Bacillota bacterium]|nr:TatD family hydrolase [Bacillota bacterium]
DDRFASDLDSILGSIDCGSELSAIILASTDEDDSFRNVLLTHRYKKLYAAIGVHPSEACKVNNGYIKSLEALCCDEKVVAIGEIGLEYHYDDAPRDVQKKIFEQQLCLAEKVGLPVVIHDREAHADCLDAVLHHNVTGVFHSYSGSKETAKILLSYGWYMSFGGIVTFKNAHKVREAAAYIPADRLLVETDCPYLAPEPYQGKRCDSFMIRRTLEVLAEIRNTTFEELEATTERNARTLFRI